MGIEKIAGIFAGIVAVFAFLPYILSILKGRTKPNRASWVIWAILGILILLSYNSSGATTTIWIPVVYAIMPLAVLALSIKNGVGGFEKLDIFCLFGALIGLLLWKLTHSPEWSLYLNIFVDALGFMPTLKKAYLKPESEDKLAWVIGASGTVINLLAINDWSVKIALYPIYTAVFNTSVAVLLFGLIQKKHLRILTRLTKSA